MEQPIAQPGQARPAPLPGPLDVSPATPFAPPVVTQPAATPSTAGPAPATSVPALPTAPAPVPPASSPGEPLAASPPAGRIRRRQRPGVGRYLAMLVVGLCPLVGIVAGILWAYGPDVDGWQRSLAKAMLILHGIALGALVLGLAVWVLMLLGGSRLY